MFGPPFSPSLARSVGHWASILSFSCDRRGSFGPLRSADFSPSRTVGVGQCDPVQPVPLVWRVDTASRNIDGPAGIADSFQIRAYSVDPSLASRSANLFAHNDPRPALADESK